MTSSLLVPTRRGLFKGFGLLLAAPAIVRINSLMPVKVLPAEELLEELTVVQLTSEAVRLWKTSSGFLQNINEQYQNIFAP